MKPVIPVVVMSLLLGCSSETPDAIESGDTNWATYLGDSGRSHYSELSQITRENVSQFAEDINSRELTDR